MPNLINRIYLSALRLMVDFFTTIWCARMLCRLINDMQYNVIFFQVGFAAKGVESETNFSDINLTEKVLL